MTTKVNESSHGGQGQVVTTTREVRQVDSEPVAFNIGSAAPSGKSTSSGHVVISQSIVSPPTNAKVNERYQ